MAASRWLRRVEILFWIVGISLLGAASGATWIRWTYQAQQERALFARGSAVPVSAMTRARPVASVPAPPSDSTAHAVVVPADAAEAAPREEQSNVAVSAPPKHARIDDEAEEETTEPVLDPDAVGRIEIPRLGVMAIVSEGADEGTLARAVGLVPGSAHPGEPGNMVLAGHRDTFFRPLRKIRLNDRIRVVVPSHIYEYRVQSLRVVAPEEKDVLASKGVDELTLVTCYPFGFIGPAPDRFIVSAARVN